MSQKNAIAAVRVSQILTQLSINGHRKFDLRDEF
jgi:hypothetical protein